MRSVADVLADLDQRVPGAGGASWDPSGLQLGDASAPVERLAVCHEVTERVVARIEADRPDLVVTYHPLLFRPTTRLVAGRTPAGRALRLIAAGAGLTVVHTSFDAAPGGTADALAAALGLTEVLPFGGVGPAPAFSVTTLVAPEDASDVMEAMVEAGAARPAGPTCDVRTRVTRHGGPDGGARDMIRLDVVVPKAVLGAVTSALVGSRPGPALPYEVTEVVADERLIGRVGSFHGTSADLVDTVGRVLGDVGLRASGIGSERVERVAVLPGSGSSFVRPARSAGADVLVTGDMDHHRVVEALDAGLGVIDPGHASTERPGMRALVDLVRAVAGGVDVIDLTDEDPTPWR